MKFNEFKHEHLMVLRDLRDLIRLTYFTSIKMNSKAPIVYRVNLNSKCIYFTFNNHALISPKLTLFIVEKNCKGSKPNLIRYKFSPKEKIEDAKGFISLEENDLINIVELREFSEIDGLANFVHGDAVEHLDFQEIQRIFNVNEVYDFIELTRLATYYSQILFCYKFGNDWYYLLNVWRKEKEVLGANLFNNYVLGAKGPEPRSGDKLAYFVKYIEGDEKGQDSFSFDRGVKLLDYFAPIIIIKKVYVFKDVRG